MALATDFDGTMARDGVVPKQTLADLEQLKRSGRRLVLVTGRRIDELLRDFPQVDLFDRVVAENGAMIYWPRTRESTLLGPPPPAEFIRALRELGITPLAVGQVIVETARPNEGKVIRTIWEMGLELQLIFNVASIMVLPPGVNKGSGLAYALHLLGLSMHEAVGIGNAENDHSFLDRCECAVAVADAVPMIRSKAMHVTRGGAGEGVGEIARALVADDLRGLHLHQPKWQILLGVDANEAPVMIPAYGINILIAGSSGSGKTTFATGLIERLCKQDYQVCVVDPEGDYGALEEIVALGNSKRAPDIQEILSVMGNAHINVAANVVGIPFPQRPEYFMQLLPNLLAMRSRSGRPHWLVLDEMHHILPAYWGLPQMGLPQKFGETIMITLNPDEVAQSALEQIDVVIAVGQTPNDVFGRFGAAVGERWPAWRGGTPKYGEVVVWFRREPRREPILLQAVPAQGERLRHLHKYAEGNLGTRSFFFRGPDRKLNLRAQNLTLFCQIGEGVDEETWLYHLRNKEYSAWFRTAIKDPQLALLTEEVEDTPGLNAVESFNRIQQAIEERYFMPRQ